MLTFAKPSGQILQDADSRLADLPLNGDPSAKLAVTTETIGWGYKRFEAARVALRHLEQFDLPRTFVSGTNRAEAGARYSVHARKLGLWTSAPVEVVSFTEEERRVSLEIHTLESHPLAGTESFVLEMHDNGIVSLTISAEAQPVLPWSKAIRPAIRIFQARFRRAAIRRIRNANARLAPREIN